MAFIAYSRFLYDLVTGRLFGASHPLSVNFHVIGRCNTNCRYCYGASGDYRGDELPLPDICRLLDEIRACGGVLIQISGGEPLLRDDLPAIVDHCVRIGLVPVVSTNARLLPERLPELSRAAAMYISIDGDEAANDLARGPGSYLAAIRALAACRRARMPVVINSVLTRVTATAEAVDHLVNLAREWRSEVKFHFLMAGCRGIPPAELVPSPEQYAAVLARIREHLAAGAPIAYSLATYDLAEKWQVRYPNYLLQRAPEIPYARCFAGRYMCMIDAAGNVYPCDQALAFFAPLNALTEGFQQAWQHVLRTNACRGCGVPQHVELNLLYAGYPAVIWRQCRLVWRRWWWQHFGNGGRD